METTSSGPEPGSTQQKLHSLTVELLSVYEELSLLYSLGPQIGRLTDKYDIGAVAIREAIEISAADCGWLGLWNGTDFEIPEQCCSGLSLATAHEIAERVLKRLFNCGKNEFLSHSFPEEHSFLQRDAPVRFLACSLTVDRKSYGFLCLGRNENRSFFLSRDQKLVRALSLIAAVQIENSRLQRSELEKQRLLDELEMARAIQSSLLPSVFPHIPFVDLAAASQPCYEIGGDFYDLLPLDESSCMMIMADVSGKGPSAALQAAVVQGVISAILQTRPCLPSLVQRLNECLLQRSSGRRFLTAFIGFLSKGGLLTYVNAAHPAALCIRKHGQVDELSETTSLLGIFPKHAFSTTRIQLRPGDTIVLYTDGIIDAENHNREIFGLSRLLDRAANLYGHTCEEIKRNLLSAVADFCGTATQADDSSILVVRFTG